MLAADQIRARIAAALPGAAVEVRDTTGGGDRFEARVRAAAFAGKSRIEQHRIVYSAVRELLASGELKALSLQTEVIT